MTSVAVRAGRREWCGLGVLVLVTLIISMDMTVLSYAVPFISAQLEPTSGQLLWITDIYAFVLSGLLIPMGTLGDRIGRRLLLMLGATAFALASAATAYASSPEMLIAGRAVMGAAGATLMPSTMSLIRTMFHDEQQRRAAIGIWSSGFSLGGVLGLLVGGALLQHFRWGSVFLINVPVMVVLLALAPVLLPEYRAPRAGRFDLLGTLLLFVSVLPAIWGIKQFAQDGWGWPQLAGVVIGPMLFVAFVLRERRLSAPMLDVGLFRSPAFGAAVVTNLLANFALVGFMFLITQFLQLVIGLQPFTAGLWSLPAAAAAGIAAAGLAPALTRMMRHAYVIAAGLLVATAGFAVLAQVNAGSGLAIVVTGHALVSGGIAMVLTLTAELIVTTVPPERAGSASGLSETASQFGSALGVALIGSLAAFVYRGDLADHAPPGVPGSVLDAARDTLGAAVAAARQLPATAGNALTAAARSAFAQETRIAALVVGAVLLFTAVVASLLLRRVSRPGPPPVTEEERSSESVAEAGQSTTSV
ncbi:MAG TPA: MFS transporter [Amycolatopsis sp.]|nr:MFS transporter [Amycolatopsis sp.]